MKVAAGRRRATSAADAPAPSRSKSAARTARAPQEVRLIGGQWKRTRLPVAHGPGLPEGLRPTPARVRETLFNWLGQDLSGWRCLDAFAGTGALGLEAASRGAADVVLLECHPRLVQALETTCARLHADQVRVQRGDALAWMRGQPPERFDLVLLDPPFGEDLLAPALVQAARLLKQGGWVYAESGHALAEADLAAIGLDVYRHAQAGAVHAHLLRLRPRHGGQTQV